MENELDVISVEDIKSKIYVIRGKQVMLDSDVAQMYQTETKKINQAVKRNMDRFPERFCFQITTDEFQNLMRSQFVTAYQKGKKFRNKTALPYVFTEQGIAMLSGLLRNEIAIQVSINIMDAFVQMRRFLLTNGQVFETLTSVEYKLLEHDKNFDKIFNLLQQKEQIGQQIFFQGQIYDAYKLIIDIIKNANKKIVIIDNYVDESILEMLTKKRPNVESIILTSKKSDIKNIDIQKFNKQYPTLKIATTDKFHDRFIILDNKELYHCGASIKDLGKKCFAISKIENNQMINLLKDIV